ncbi:60S ribosomal protein L18a [Hibiscus syriacus]|uniref:60S ribosomal protein L18a n=1 Tax=Hibiscus syriacus TaxID=106335 RepID=A0A6A3C3Q5_HIBSY|nr:60S ribosomal protein L18a [Hibiscus syriacus]
MNLTLIVFVTMVLLVVDWCGWKIVRLPLAPFYLTSPFFISLILASCAGYIGVPLLRIFKFHEVVRKIGPPKYMRKKRTPTMGGLFFVPVGIAVARFATGVYSVEVAATAAATFAFAAIGLLDDALSFTKRKCGMDPWLRLLLEAAVGVWFSFWLYTTNLSTPYGMKMLVPYRWAFCGWENYTSVDSILFRFHGKGVNLADGLDGLVAGTAALAFIGMAIAVLPICPELSIFVAAMAGACIGFLLHNQYKAAVIMGDTGSSALSGSLAAMACTGMFFPLFIASGFFVWKYHQLLCRCYTSNTQSSTREVDAGCLKWYRCIFIWNYFQQYQVVGRAHPTESDEHPKIYRMKHWATNEVRAKSKFWYFLRKLKKVKKSNGQVLAINEIFEKNPTKIKNYGIWLRYQSRTGYHNMYKEYRDTTLNGAVEQMYTEMASRHRVRFPCIQIIKTATIPAKLCKRDNTKQFHNSKIKFPLVVKKVRPPTRKLKTTYKASRPNLFM